MLHLDELLEAASPDATGSRILDATLEQLETFGVRRTTIEDVARGAGVARVTVYRRFKTKDDLIQAVVIRETRRFFAALEASIAAYDTISDRLAEGFAFTLDFLRNHSLLNRLLKIEPDAVLPYATVNAGHLVAIARSYLASLIQQDVDEGRLAHLDAGVVAEMLVRLVLSFLITPDTALTIGTPDEARRFARSYLVPVLERQSQAVR